MLGYEDLKWWLPTWRVLLHNKKGALKQRPFVSERIDQKRKFTPTRTRWKSGVAFVVSPASLRLFLPKLV